MKLERSYSPILIGLVYLSFVSLGLPDGLNGVAWPSIRAHFGLPVDALGSLLMVFTVGYLVSSLGSGRVLALMNLGSLLALSSLATAISLAGYALAPSWWVIVALGLIAGLGAGAIDAGLNTFAATQVSPRMVNWLHACYGVGAASGPVIMTSNLGAHHPWQRGYAMVGVWQLLLAICFALTRRWWPVTSASEFPHSKQAARVNNASTLKLPVTWLGIWAFFLYTGIEAAAGTWAYTLFTESRAVPMMAAGVWVSVYWGSLTIGRVLAGIVVGFVQANRLLRISAAGIAVGAALIWLNLTVISSFAGLGLMGFASAPIFPVLIATTPARLGPSHTGNGVGFQIGAAVLGQSLVPALIGVLAGEFGLEIIGPSLLVAAALLLASVQGLTTAGIVARAREAG